MAATAEMKPGSKVTFTVTKLPAKESLRLSLIHI